MKFIIISDYHDYEFPFTDFDTKEKALLTYLEDTWNGDNPTLYGEIKVNITKDLESKLKQILKEERLEAIKRNIENYKSNMKSYKHRMERVQERLERGDWYDDDVWTIWCDGYFNRRPYKPQKKDLLHDIEQYKKALERTEKELKMHEDLQTAINEGIEVLYWNEHQHHWKVKKEFGGEPFVKR